ncbi:M15 family metallopeptidase [Romboutsia sp.]|uniref:M15 family metallopeptidase n=1 Tax=Romboutsia sp. TaxID=1965302 RepID=UPI003F327FE5
MKISKYIILPIALVTVLTTFIMKGEDSEVSSLQQNYENNSKQIILVNDENKLGLDYKPVDLKIPQIPFIDDATNEEQQIEVVVVNAIEELFKVAKSEGINLLGTSAYRSYETQMDIYKKRIKSHGRKSADEYVAKPGSSEHQSGLAIDVTNEDRWFVESTKEATWLKQNAHRFGFILRYPKGKEYITGKSYEPWHIRYVGKEIAKVIFEKGITLEEYIQNK